MKSLLLCRFTSTIKKQFYTYPKFLIRPLSFITLLSVLWQPVCAQQSGSIKGTVKTADGNPAGYVSIAIKGTSRRTAADEQGAYELKNVKPGTYILIASHVGQQSQEREISVTENKTAFVHFTLGINAQELKEVAVNGNRNNHPVAVNPSQSLRLNTPLIETPQNITVTTAQTIRNIGALSLAEILRTSSGIIAGGDKQDISFNVRGTQVYSSILRNGVGSGYWYNQEADAAMIDRVEFIKGPAGFMISNTEPGGLVNIVTKQPTHDRITNINFGLGSWNLMRTNIDLGGELTKNSALTYRLNMGLQRQSDYYQFGAFNKNFIAAVLKYEVDSTTSITAEYNRMSSRQLSDGQFIPTINGKFFALPNSFGTIDPNVPGTKSADNYYRFQVSHKLDDKWRLNAQAAVVNGPWGGTMMYTEGTSTNYDTLYRYMAYTDWKNKLYTIQAFLDGSFSTGSHIEHKVLGGIDYGHTDVESLGGNTYGDHNRYYLLLSNPTYYIPTDSLNDFDRNSFDSKYGNRYAALYIQDHIKFYGKMILTLAARYTNSVSYANYSDPIEVTDNKLVPRFGLTYLFTDHISAYAMYDGAFIPQNGKSFAGQVFKPLTGNNKEFGLKGQFLDRFNASVAIYRLTKNNALTTDPQHPSFQVQAGQLVSQGVEFDINGNVLPNLNLFANYAYTDAKITKDNDPVLVGLINSGAVKNTVNFFGRYTFSKGSIRGFSLGGGLAYSGPISGGLNYNDNTFAGYLPARTILEASIGYSVKKIYININAYNLTNKMYVVSGSRSTGNDWLYSPGTPRNFRLSLGLNL